MVKDKVLGILSVILVLDTIKHSVDRFCTVVNLRTARKVSTNTLSYVEGSALIVIIPLVSFAGSLRDCNIRNNYRLGWLYCELIYLLTQSSHAVAVLATQLVTPSSL